MPISIIIPLLATLYAVPSLAQTPAPETSTVPAVTSAEPSFNYYFKSSYEDSARDFDTLFARLKPSYPQASTLEYQYSQGTIKSYFFPAPQTENLLIMISGTHGIEGFTGSAVQRYLMDNQDLKLKKTSVLMVHGFNLYGFKNWRRVNENNVDLNRNFVIDRAAFKPDDSAYTGLNGFLNPAEPPVTGFFSHALFLGQAVLNIARSSVEALRASILKGQYSFPRGIFYGGAELQPQAGLIEALTAEYVKPSYKKVFIIDLHTGYGERAKLHLLAGKAAEPNSQALLKVFSRDQIDFADKKKFYAVQGEMLAYFVNRIRHPQHQGPVPETSAVTFEYGTLDSQKLTGSIESLRRMILENQNFQHPGDERSAKEIHDLFREMFYPSAPEWRAAVLKQTDEKMSQVFTYLEK